MKGQMVFEFVVAAVLFFSIIIYVISFLNSNVSSYTSDFYMNDLENKAMQISELLTHNKGYWNQSESGYPQVVGLEQEWPVLNTSKITYADQACNSDYSAFLRKLDLEEVTYYGMRLYKVRILVDDLGAKTVLMDCGRMPPGLAQNVYVQRFAVSDNNNMLRIGVWVWG